MKFLCVGYFDQEKMAALSPAELRAVMQKCPAHMRNFYATGRVLTVVGAGGPAQRLRRRRGRLAVTAGPASPAGGSIGCVFLVEAASRAEAIRVAALHPTTQIEAGESLGWRTEIHPVHYFRPRAANRPAKKRPETHGASPA